MDMNMKREREKMFARIESAVLPEAERRIAAIAPFDVLGLPFGAKAKAKAFSEKGELRFDLGMWNGTRFEPFASPMLFPVDPDILKFKYPKELPQRLCNLYAHYTPVTRRIDYMEVHDYFYVSRLDDKAARAKALGLLAFEIARKFPAEAVETSVRYVRYAEQYMVVTGIRSRAFSAAGAAEAKNML